jgi:hypothetical protein
MTTVWHWKPQQLRMVQDAKNKCLTRVDYIRAEKVAYSPALKMAFRLLIASVVADWRYTSTNSIPGKKME